jgi:hypothetical protein
MSSVIGLTVNSREDFKRALRDEGYSDNAKWDVVGSNRLDSLREATTYSTDPELHFENFPQKPTAFNAHWDPTSVNFDIVSKKFIALGIAGSIMSDFHYSPAEAGREMERAWAGSQHGDHPTPSQVREYQKRIGIAPEQ